MNNQLFRLMEKYREGSKPAIHLGPFLPLVRLKQTGLSFNAIMTDSQAMTKAALMSFELGFESTVLPFDLNVEAEILGARVIYHEGFEGNPVYPTIADKPFSVDDPIDIPDDLSEKGRMPVILKSIRSIKTQMKNNSSVGVFLPGPFTLAGQVMDMDALFLMLMKQPEKSRKLFEQLTELIQKVIDVYVAAGVDFMMLKEGGGASISPKIFSKLLLPCLQDIFRPKKIPQIASFSGSSDKIVEFMLACDPDGIVLNRELSIEKAIARLPATMPIFGKCETNMLANDTPAEIKDNVHRLLDMGFTSVDPPADIYPPAKIENIEAFVGALRDYNR